MEPIEESRQPQRLYAPSRSALRTPGTPGTSGPRGTTSPAGPEPWRVDHPWRPAGQEPDYKASAGGASRIRWVVLGLIGLCNLALLSPLHVKTLLILLDAFGLVFLADTVFRLWQATRRTRVRWTTFPAFLGGRLEGMLIAQPTLQPIGPVRAVLRCLRDERVVHPAAGAAAQDETVSFEPTVLYQQITEIPVPGETLQQLPLSFTLPSDLPGTDLGRDDAVYWQLAFRVPVVGPDVETVFLAPVYAPPA